MADDLVFPPDDLSFGDFEPNLLADDVLRNINPAFPHSELLNIPQIYPSHSVAPGDARNYNNTLVNNVTNNMYNTPISQLMKQTQDLVSTLDSPLNSNLNEQLSFNNQLEPGGAMTNQQVLENNLKNQLVSNNINYVNQPASKSSQYLVVGGQRIQIPAPQQSQIQSPLLAPQQPQTSNRGREGSPLLNIGHSSNLTNSSLSFEQQQQTANTIPNKNIQLNNTSQSVLNIQNSQPSSNIPPKQSILVKLPNQPGQPNQKGPPLKGSIIKTSDQQLMFVTEVNGKKVGYVIQQSKQSSSSPSISQSINNSIPVSVPSPNVASPSSISSDTSLDMQGKNQISSIQDLDILKQAPNKEKEKSMAKTLRERLQGIGTSLIKNQVNLKTVINLPTMNKQNNEKLVVNDFIESKMVHVNPIAQILNPVSKIISDFDNAMPDSRDDNKQENNVNTVYIKDDVLPTTPQQHMNYIMNEEEEGQEIEFSENDLTTDFNEDSDEPLITAVKARECEDIIDLSKQISNDDDDSDSVPLALLKNEAFEEPFPIVCEKEDDEIMESVKPAKRSKKYFRESSDSLPLSVVAASLKKHEDSVPTKAAVKKKKPRGRKKKKDNDEPVKPISGYQVFFSEIQLTVKEKNPIYKEFGELSKKVANLWEVLDPEKKKAYQDAHNEAKAVYNIKLAEYKEIKAQREADLNTPEILSPVPIDESSRDNPYEDDEDDEDAPLKKTTKKKVTKKTYSRKKQTLTSHTIATTTTLSPPLDHYHKDDSNDSVLSVEPMELDMSPKPKATRKQPKNKKAQPPSSQPSPSPPSSDTNSSEEEDDDILRIRQLAAKASKQLRKIEKKTVKGRTKEIAAKRGGRVTKMEVETVSEKVVIEHAPPPVFDIVKPVIVETLSPPLPILSQPLLLIPQLPSPKATAPSPKATPPPKVTAKASKVNKEKPVKSIILKEKLEKLEVDKDKEEVEKEQLPSPPLKASFKIPKRTHGENGQIVQQGPRLCVRVCCENPIKATRERGGQYCSNDCLVLYCREVFDSWVMDRETEDEGAT